MGVPARCPLPEMGAVGGRLWLPQRRGAEGFCPQLFSGDAQGHRACQPPVCAWGGGLEGLSALGTSVKEWGCAELSMEVPSIPSAVDEGGFGECSVFFGWDMCTSLICAPPG